MIPPLPRTRTYGIQVTISTEVKKITQPSGAATPRDSDTHERIAVPRLSAFFESALDQGSKAAKFAVLILGHAGFPKRVKRSEGRDTTPIRNARVSPCKPLCAILLAKASVYPLLPMKANVAVCARS